MLVVTFTFTTFFKYVKYVKAHTFFYSVFRYLQKELNRRAGYTNTRESWMEDGKGGSGHQLDESSSCSS